VSGGGVGTEVMRVNLATDRHPGTKYKRSKIAFAVTSIALSLGRRGTQLLGVFWKGPNSDLDQVWPPQKFEVTFTKWSIIGMVEAFQQAWLGEIGSK